MNNAKPTPGFFLADWLLLFLGIFSMSISAIFLKLAATAPLTVGFYRMVFAVIGASPLVFLEARKRAAAAGFFSKERWPAIRFALFGGAIFGVSLSIWNTAVLHSNATTATLLNNLAPLWTGLIMLLYFKEKPSDRFWFGLAVALVGAGVMFWPEVSSFRLHWTTWLLLFGSFCYAFYVIFQKKARQLGLSSVEMLWWMSLATGAFIGLECLLTGAPMWGFPARTWLSMAGAGLVSSLLGWGLIGHAMLRLPVTVTALALLNQAVFTGIMDYLVFGVRLTGFQVVGGLVVLAGLGLVVFKKG